MECAKIAVAVLAAGRATRFGSDKLMVPLNGTPLGTHVARTLAPLGFGWHFAICAKNAPVSQQYAALDFAIVENATPDSGQAHSLHLAVAAAGQTQAAALLIVLADMPFVTQEHFTHIAAHGGLCASSNRITAMPPALFPRSFWPRLLVTSEDRGAGALLRDARLFVASPEELRDIDRLVDLARLSSR